MTKLKTTAPLGNTKSWKHTKQYRRVHITVAGSLLMTVISMYSVNQ